ncbi:NUDIX domain-containing protein [Streptomyces sp. NRRL F-5123]|uniref:NUDIX domain-containing protein n=1 Tax=Streptomyces sp. NRRL F-5123 TaxID=1463856 RepID=UPI000694EC9A|nr:NUDIX domain-containing protein [Streptomyces sp. NRRL F-5123]
MTLLAAAVIVHDRAADRVLLIRRGDHAKFAPGHWDLPCGKSDPGEPVTTTAVRELHEETGLVAAPESLRLAHVIHGAWGVESPNGFVTVVFSTTAWSGTAENREPAKHSTVTWTPVTALPTPFVPSSSTALTSYLASSPPSLTIRGWD